MTTTATLTFSQFIDLLLARLYDAQRENRDGMIDLNAIATDLNDSVPEDWTVDAAKILQARGLADCMISFGACRARLTGDGMLFVEEGRGSGVINQYRQRPAQFFQHVNVSGAGNNVTVAGNDQSGINPHSTIPGERPQVFRLLAEIQDHLEKDKPSATSSARKSSTTSNRCASK